MLFITSATTAATRCGGTSESANTVEETCGVAPVLAVASGGCAGGGSLLEGVTAAEAVKGKGR